MEYGEDTQTVNLAGMTVEEITPVIGILEALPNLSYADLMTDGGTCELSRQDVKRLMEAAPDVRFHYVFTLFGRTVSTSDEEIKFEKLSLTTDAEAEIREAMSIMAPGSSLILDRCGLSSEFLDSIRKDYDDVDLVWRVYYGTDGRIHRSDKRHHHPFRLQRHRLHLQRAAICPQRQIHRYGSQRHPDGFELHRVYAGTGNSDSLRLCRPVTSPALKTARSWNIWSLPTA